MKTILFCVIVCLGSAFAQRVAELGRYVAWKNQVFVNQATAGQDGANAAPLRSKISSSATWATADFDGDHKADWVIARKSVRAGHSYDLVFRSGEKPRASFAAQHRLATQQLRARDIDGDSDTDLVLETLSSRPVAIWLNDGRGHFQEGDLDLYLSSLSPPDSHRWNSPLPDLTREQNSEESGSDVVVTAASGFEPFLAESSFILWYGDTERPAYLAGIHARGPPSYYS